MKVLILPDIHGRKFWVKPCENIDKYDKVVFLGDYFDPYDFENIDFNDCIDNFKEIIKLKEKYPNKVVLLLGNHDMPYSSNHYYHFSMWHCRHSSTFHDKIAKLFDDNKSYFEIAHVEKDVLFTHAGVESGWLEKVVKCQETDINKICDILNELPKTVDGLEKLYSITRERGGRDKYGSCIWADVHDLLWDVDSINEERKPIHNIKQIFGHTLQAFYNMDRKIEFGDAIEFENLKMIDTAKPYELDTDTFKIKEAK